MARDGPVDPCQLANGETVGGGAQKCSDVMMSVSVGSTSGPNSSFVPAGGGRASELDRIWEGERLGPKQGGNGSVREHVDPSPH